MSGHVSLEVEIISILVFLGGGIAFVVRLGEAIKTLKELSESKFAAVKQSIEGVKEDLKDLIEENKESQRQALEDTKEELKEDIARLEIKQEKSNCIKERLAKQELYMEQVWNILNKFNKGT